MVASSSCSRQPPHRKCCQLATKFGRVGRRAIATIAPKVPTMVGKTCQVSESFGSSSVASLRTPPTYNRRLRFPRAGVRARVRMILPAPTAVRYVPSVPQSIPRCWVTLVYLQIPIGSVTAKQRVVSASLTRQWRCMGETHVRFVRSSLGIGSVPGGCSNQGQPLCC